MIPRKNFNSRLTGCLTITSPDEDRSGAVTYLWLVTNFVCFLGFDQLCGPCHHIAAMRAHPMKSFSLLACN
ncbi:hypothetical protein OIU84_029521 [Salix udensis]|uniref:Uncharacterized protein n=1 Tax=Salix udensis TaxID=889485 RepID=A0AAD6P827_9ROSI|nr:hypothetical protein OIU84_029521 [Salix udensis]